MLTVKDPARTLDSLRGEVNLEHQVRCTQQLHLYRLASSYYDTNSLLKLCCTASDILLWVAKQRAGKWRVHHLNPDEKLMYLQTQQASMYSILRQQGCQD